MTPPTSPTAQAESKPNSGTVVLAFSGGLDTSYCVPLLLEQGYQIITLFVDTGGVSDAEVDAIEARALELGAARHVYHDAGGEIWNEIVTPLVISGAAWHGQYPLLCADRYVIARRMVTLAEEVGAVAIAHGCTGMGNDQVRFDVSLASLTDLPILAPIRDLGEQTSTPRQFEADYLTQRGFDVPSKQSRYTINHNCLGATTSGSEIDEFGAPADDAREMTAPRSQWPAEPERITLDFVDGVCTAIDDEHLAGPEILKALNRRLGAHGVGRSIYTGDTMVGLKGRIVFECPGITALRTAHRALEETILTRSQNRFKPHAGEAWAELVYSGLFFEPLREDLEAFLASTQRFVTGRVALEACAGRCDAVALTSPNMLTRAGATYAQASDWSAEEAAGFIRLFGQSSVIASKRARAGVGV